MKGFIVFTQGRTGSTAIVDELGKHPQIACHQELFINRVNAPKLMEAYETYGTRFLDHVENPYKVLPMEFYYRQFHSLKLGRFGLFFRDGTLYSQKKLLAHYLDELKNPSETAEAIGFKVLVNHFYKWPELYECLLAADYAAIYLERKNVVKKVLSGMVAEARGIYNRKNFTPPDEKYHIDVENFTKRIAWDLKQVSQEKRLLRDKGFELLEVSYEDFLADRNAFFEPICSFLGVDHIVPERSEYTIMVNKRADEIISNCTELREELKLIGMDEQLDL